MGLLKKAILLPVVFAAIYLVLLVLASFHIFQEYLIFLNWLRIPFRPKFHQPEYFGFAHNAVRNFKLTTEDHLTLGAWHILPSEYHDKEGLRYKDDLDESVYDAALMNPDYDTMIYFHGNSLSRTAPIRIDFYKNLWARYPKLNILTFDYRGFGESEGAPQEFGLELDARAAYDWLISKKVSPSRITLTGHSLGTGVATTLAHSLSKAGTPPHALILQAAFTSVGKVLFEYRLFETFPPFWLYSKLGVNEETVISRFRQKFDSLSRIADVKCPILIVVGSNDFEIPPIHSKQLFYGALGKDPLALTDNIEKEAGIQVRQVQHEATVYTHSSSSLVQLVILSDANHNNLAYYDYLYKSMDEVTLWPKSRGLA